MRQRGAGYLEILEAGGGILSTVAATRAATLEDLMAHGRRWLDEMLGHGVTTIEAKSGYGLDLATEIRLLEVAHRLGQEGPIDIVPTYLGAHAVPLEFRSRPDGTEAYVRSIIEDQLPGVAAQGRARFCDVFCEERRVQRRPVAPDPRGGGRRSAWRPGCTPTSWRHRAAPSWRPRSARSRPTTSRRRPTPASTRCVAAGRGGPDAAAPGRRDRAAGDDLVPDEATTRAPARRFIERGIPVALGTDFNPGTSPTASLPLAMTVACLELGLSPDEALAAVTINAAWALGLERRDRFDRARQAARTSSSGASRPRPRSRTGPAPTSSRTVVKRGRVVLDRRLIGATEASRSGLPRASSRTVVVSIGRLVAGHRQLRLGRRPRRPSRGRSA